VGGVVELLICWAINREDDKMWLLLLLLVVLVEHSLPQKKGDLSLTNGSKNKKTPMELECRDGGCRWPLSGTYA